MSEDREQETKNLLAIQVLLPLPLGTYDYLAPDDISIGEIVLVSFGKKKLYGVVWGKKPSEFKELKNIIEKVELPPLSAKMIEFVEWVADYTMYPKGSILKMVMGVPETFKRDEVVYFYYPPLFQKTENRKQITSNSKNLSSDFCHLVAPSPNPQADLTLPQGEGNKSILTTFKLTPSRKKVLDLLSSSPLTKQDIKERAEVGDSVIKGLLDNGLIEKKECFSFLNDNYTPTLTLPPEEGGGNSNESSQRDDTSCPPSLLGEGIGGGCNVQLSSTQQKAVDEITENKPYLLDGVTGSGKTEVYFELIARILNKCSSDNHPPFVQKTDDRIQMTNNSENLTSDFCHLVDPSPKFAEQISTLPQGEGDNHINTSIKQQILVLLPEIGLSVQWLERFKKRFGFTPYQWHSDVSPSQKKKIWRSVATGNIQIIVGTRSALFLPFSNLSLIIVDEEHDGSFKQEEGVRYNARDMAVVKSKIEEIPLILVSATPSLETIYNVKKEKYGLIHLPTRHKEVSLPDIKLVDMRKYKKERGFISPPLKEALVNNAAKGFQSLLFLNRRGYAPLVLCRECGYRFICPNCTAWLVYHKGSGLCCHHCGHSLKTPKSCPDCGKKANFAPCGPGVERVEEEIKSLLPQARTAIATTDTINSPEKADELIAQIENKEVDIIIGTQMVAKGYHFPLLTVVGVIDADIGLTGGDLRAIEKTYQVLHQAAGRAGREEHPGTAYIQTHYPEHPVMKALKLYDKDEILFQELQAREESTMPPFARLATFIISGKNEKQVQDFAKTLVMKAPKHEGIRIIGPAPSPLYKVRNNFRYRILIKSHILPQKFIRQWLAKIKTPSNINLKIDIDPYSFL